MKKRPFFMSIVFTLVVSNGIGQTINEPYIYPVKPGTPEWSKLKNRFEKGKATAIPESTLKNLTTEALVQTCLDFPMFKDLYFFNQLQTGFNTLRKSFNGFDELLNRHDAFEKLYRAYIKIDPSEIVKMDNNLSKGDYGFRILSLEILLAQTEILNNLNEQQRGQLVNTSIRIFDSKKEFGLSQYIQQVSMLIGVRALTKNKEIQALSKEKLTEFEQTGTTNYTDIVDSIYLIAKTVK